MSAPNRPILRYHGGKWRLAPWIIKHFPAHRTYVEPFGGGASVLLRKRRSYAEVYNDLDGEIVNLFRVIREQPERLARVVEATPFARSEFEASYEPGSDPVEQARRTVFRSAAGFGSAGASGRKTGFRSNVTRPGTHPATDWSGMPEVVRQVARRLAGVVVENRPALEVIAQFDGPSTLFYVDPPYPFSTRTETAKWDHNYRHEMGDDDHRVLAERLHEVDGMVVLSGYPCSLYDDLFAGWRRFTKAAVADSAAQRVECLWVNRSGHALELFA